MEVSTLKSKVLSGRPSIAAAVIEQIDESKLTHAYRAKMLGTDSVGGSKRSTVTFCDRLSTFAQAVPQLHALRKAGVNSHQMVRTAGTPAVMYGCEVFGLSDSALYLARSKIAAAAAAPTGGKSIELLLHLLDGPAGTLDPAFEAHTSPLLLWTIAVWERWFSRDQLAKAFTQASLKVAKKEGESCWSLVTGPATALLASLARIGWTMPNAFEAIDDSGVAWNFDEVSPGAIAAACKESVRRWRLLRVGSVLPGLIPSSCDIGAPNCATGTVLVEINAPLHTLIHCKGAGAQANEQWQPAWRHDLLSAAVNGQWTQARKASVPKWCIDDNRCQLCFLAPGTATHRFQCSVTRPTDGWPQQPQKANRVLSRLSQQRQDHLTHHGLLVLRLPAPPANGNGTFVWLKAPSEALLAGEEVCWHFDGSMLHGRWRPYRATGFGIVVTAGNGHLIAYGQGQPPHWCKTAAAAEAWALCNVVSQAPFLPSMRTDCLTLIATAAAGIARATEPRRVLASIWVLIGMALDGDIQQLGDSSALVWVPAHMSPSSIGQSKRSDGARLSHVDWRANRLADGLAKQAAAWSQPPAAALRLLASALVAVRHAAMLLARVTHAANNHIVVTEHEDGSTSNKKVRDAVDKPRLKKDVARRCAALCLVPGAAIAAEVSNTSRGDSSEVYSQSCGPSLEPAADAASTPQPSGPGPVPAAGVSGQVKPWAPPVLDSGRQPSAATAHKRRTEAVNRELLQRRVSDIGARLRPSTSGEASVRLGALNARIRMRCGQDDGLN